MIDPDTGRPSAPGDAGTLVATPFPPFRDTTVLLRYDTEDVVRVPVGPASRCAKAAVPAVSDVLGKRRLAVRHDVGWTYPREVLEALEGLDAVPLPARCGAWAVPGGVAVEVLVRDPDEATRRAVVRALEQAGIPVRAVHLRRSRTELEHPLPLRCDLKEVDFGRAGGA